MPTVPNLVVFRDDQSGSYLHPITHYVFSDDVEGIALPSDNYVVVELSADGKQVNDIVSYSPMFQPTGGNIETVSIKVAEGQGLQGSSDGNLTTLTIEGLVSDSATPASASTSITQLLKDIQTRQVFTVDTQHDLALIRWQKCCIAEYD
ncbi:hypothetical protein BZG36_04172 [Bifiguratus adelaidae]|uniref:Uncharacterized protein n=1 Tax=Bifiguratus adelaidae TaxID=1938954 RepID=A0A261XYX5_9FUNG|nr:hypothetical protein BZG36_04172 [Bifiguratus adelaidae]